MTYHAPELLLVGAAQNIVLLGSDVSNKIDVCPSTEEPENLPEYNNSARW